MGSGTKSKDEENEANAHQQTHEEIEDKDYGQLTDAEKAAVRQTLLKQLEKNIRFEALDLFEKFGLILEILNAISRLDKKEFAVDRECFNRCSDELKNEVRRVLGNSESITTSKKHAINEDKLRFLKEKLEFGQFDDVFMLLSQVWKDENETLTALKNCAVKCETQKQKPVWDMSNWMSNVEPTTEITSLKIPGTHDTATFAINRLTKSAVTQFLNVKQQLERGARWLDARVDDYRIFLGPKCSGNTGLGHNVVPAEYCFEEMLQDIMDFLKNHEKEIVFLKISMGKETPPNFYPSEVQKEVWEMLKKHIEGGLCPKNFKTLEEFQKRTKRLCIYGDKKIKKSMKFIKMENNEQYVFPDNKSHEKNVPKAFDEDLKIVSGTMTRTRLNTIGKFNNIHETDLKIYYSKDPNKREKYENWFETNVEKMNFVSMDFLGEKSWYIEKMMDANKKFAKKAEKAAPLDSSKAQLLKLDSDSHHQDLIMARPRAKTDKGKRYLNAEESSQKVTIKFVDVNENSNVEEPKESLEKPLGGSFQTEESFRALALGFLVTIIMLIFKKLH